MSNESTEILNLDVVLYPEAPENFKDTQSGKLIINNTELQLPGDISFSLGKLKNAKYEKFEDKHVIKITTTSENDFYFSCSGANKLKSISYAESISDAIQKFILANNKTINLIKSDEVKQLPPNAAQALLDAIDQNNINEVKSLISLGINVNFRSSNDDFTPLHEAAAEGFLDIVKTLIEHNADVNAKDKELGLTPL